MQEKYFTQLSDWIMRCEGYKQFPYADTTGHITIGYGRNLYKEGVSQLEATVMMQFDIHTVIKSLQEYSWFNDNPFDVQMALANMGYNLGIEGLLEFKEMIAALEAKDYAKAASEALNSKWAEQVGQRAKDVAVMIREAK